jgi:hypothetical protein
MARALFIGLKPPALRCCEQRSDGTPDQRFTVRRALQSHRRVEFAIMVCRSRPDDRCFG